MTDTGNGCLGVTTETPDRIELLGLCVNDVLLRRDPTRRYRTYRSSRGMSVVHDWIDWLGGWPFEVAKPEEIVDFYRTRGFELAKLKTVAGSLGCNEFVFERR